jgi:Acetyl-CoA dehydrogenase C-terminal like
LKRMIAGYRATAGSVKKLNEPAFGAVAARIEEGVTSLESASQYLLAALGKNSVEIFAGATPYLRLFGLVAGASYLAEAALASHAATASGDKDPAHGARIATARFFAENLLPATSGLERTVVDGAQSVLQSEAALVA